MKNFKMNSILLSLSMMALTATASAAGTLVQPSSIENRPCLSVATDFLQSGAVQMNVFNEDPDTEVGFITLTKAEDDAPRYAANEILVDSKESGKCQVYENPVPEDYFSKNGTDSMIAILGYFTVDSSYDLKSMIISYKGDGLSCGANDYKDRPVKAQLELRGHDLYKNSFQVLSRNPCPGK